MPKANDVATELHMLANHLAEGGDLEVKIPSIYLSYRYGGDKAKDEFLALAKLLPRPLKKHYGSHDLELKFETEALYVCVAIERDKVCRLVEPAKPAVYECEPVLSPEEEGALPSAGVD